MRQWIAAAAAAVLGGGGRGGGGLSGTVVRRLLEELAAPGLLLSRPRQFDFRHCASDTDQHLTRMLR